jgi:hypothetical protein
MECILLVLRNSNQQLPVINDVNRSYINTCKLLEPKKTSKIK